MIAASTGKNYFQLICFALVQFQTIMLCPLRSTAVAIQTGKRTVKLMYWASEIAALEIEKASH